MTRKEFLKLLLEHYDIVKELSKKEYSSLLLLRHKTLGENLIVRSTARMLPVADFLKTIISPNLPEVYDVVKLEDGEVILEEYLTGVTMDEVLSSRLYSWKEAKAILLSLTDALAVIHNAGFVHRDVKPKNIMITDLGDVKLIDFDAARIATGESDTVRLGTAGFAAPEQFVGVSDPRTDIFALGVLLNVMLTGRHPSETLAKNLRARHIIKKATSMNPENRYASAEEFRKAL